MPWQYFHIMNLMMMLNLMLWAYSFAFQDSYFASLIFVFVAAIFMGIRELCVALADPYGDDAADFPLNEWMNQLYVRVLYLCEDNWSAEEMMKGATDEPLPQVKSGHSVIDLLIDIENEEAEKAGRSGSKEGSGKRDRKRYITTRWLNKAAPVIPTDDGCGDYIQIPAGVDQKKVQGREIESGI